MQRQRNNHVKFTIAMILKEENDYCSGIILVRGKLCLLYICNSFSVLSDCQFMYLLLPPAPPPPPHHTPNQTL